MDSLNELRKKYNLYHDLDYEKAMAEINLFCATDKKCISEFYYRNYFSSLNYLFSSRKISYVEYQIYANNIVKIHVKAKRDLNRTLEIYKELKELIVPYFSLQTEQSLILAKEINKSSILVIYAKSMMGTGLLGLIFTSILCFLCFWCKGLKALYEARKTALSRVKEGPCRGT